MSFNECKVMFNKYDFSNTMSNNFFNFVFNKISRNQKDRFVEKENETINVIPSSNHPIKVIPIFKDMNKNDLSLTNEIDIACNHILNGEIKCIYFVYPKNENFDKHIQIKVPKLEDACSEYMIKLIPYSLRDLYKQGHNNGNCNILCK